MGEKCAFCGKPLSGNEQAVRRFDGSDKEAHVCLSCAEVFDGGRSKDYNKQSFFVSWANQLLDLDTVDPEFRQPLMAVVTDMVNKVPSLASSKDYGGSKTSAGGIYQANSDNVWAAIVKVLGAICILVFTIIGGVVGYSLSYYNNDQTMLGVFIGLTAGLVSGSVMMMAATACQDISKIKNTLNNIRNNKQ